MAQAIYLAMTAAEFAHCSLLPAQVGWMACHFSPYGTGLSNLPAGLPPDSMVILNDRIPIRGHDPRRVTGQLLGICEEFRCSALLLDFQRPGLSETADLTACLTRQDFPCPVGISLCYCHHGPGAVFLPPCPHHVSLSDHLAPVAGREIWLELARDAQTITLTESGAVMHPLPPEECPNGGFREPRLHGHYAIETTPSSARFALWRNREDLDSLIHEATGLGINTFVGLWQEWR